MSFQSFRAVGQEGHVVVRIAAKVRLAGRTLSPHGLFGPLHAVRLPDAARLVRAGVAEPLGSATLWSLRRAVTEAARHAATASPAA